MVSVTGWIATVLDLFLFALFARLVIDYVRMFKPDWRPRGLLLPILEIIYTITEKPLSFIRRFVPPLRMGPVALDLSFIILFFGVQLLIGFLR